MPSQNFMHIIDKPDNLKLFNDNVLVEIFDMRAFKNGVHITITDSNPFVPLYGKVIAKADIAIDISINDIVCFEQYKGERFKTADGKRQFLLLKHSYLLAVINDVDNFSKLENILNQNRM